MYTCVFCGKDYDDEGIADLEPLCDDGQCCESCYGLYVIPAKMSELSRQMCETDEDEYNNEWL